MICCTRSTAAAILAATVFSVSAAAKQDEWTSLNKLRPGDQIGLIQTDQRRLNGRFQSANESSITLLMDREVTVQKADVLRLYRRSGLSRLTRALIGAAAGIAAGAILTATVGQRFTNEGQDTPAAAWIAGGVGVGAGVAALTGSGYKTIYARPAAP